MRRWHVSREKWRQAAHFRKIEIREHTVLGAYRARKVRPPVVARTPISVHRTSCWILWNDRPQFAAYEEVFVACGTADDTSLDDTSLDPTTKSATDVVSTQIGTEVSTITNSLLGEPMNHDDTGNDLVATGDFRDVVVLPPPSTRHHYLAYKSRKGVNKSQSW